MLETPYAKRSTQKEVVNHLQDILSWVFEIKSKLPTPCFVVHGKGKQGATITSQFGGIPLTSNAEINILFCIYSVTTSSIVCCNLWCCERLSMSTPADSNFKASNIAHSPFASAHHQSEYQTRKPPQTPKNRICSEKFFSKLMCTSQSLTCSSSRTGTSLIQPPV